MDERYYMDDGKLQDIITDATVPIRVRKLTPLECWRIMGFDDDDFYAVKDIPGMTEAKLIKQAGNSIVVDVLEAIMRELRSTMPHLFSDMVVGSFFSGIGAFEKALSRVGTDLAPATDGRQADFLKGNLHQIGYINNYNGDANRVYDGTCIARTLKADAGGGGAKTGWYTETVKIRQATRSGEISCAIGGVANLAYPNSDTRRGRVQGGGMICPTITASSLGVYRIEKRGHT